MKSRLVPEEKLGIVILDPAIFFIEVIIEALEEDEDFKGSGVGRDEYMHNPC